MKTRRADEKKERNRNALHPIRFEWTGSIDSSMRWDVKLMTAATLPLHLRRFIIANEHFALHKHPRQYISSEHSFFFLVFFFWHFCSRPCIAAAVKVVVDSILLLPAEEWFFFLILFIFVAAKGTDRAAAHADNRPLDVSSLPGYQFWLLMSRGSINKTKRIQAGENTHTHTHTHIQRKGETSRSDKPPRYVCCCCCCCWCWCCCCFFSFPFFLHAASSLFCRYCCRCCAGLPTHAISILIFMAFRGPSCWCCCFLSVCPSHPAPTVAIGNGRSSSNSSSSSSSSSSTDPACSRFSFSPNYRLRTALFSFFFQYFSFPFFVACV